MLIAFTIGSYSFTFPRWPSCQDSTSAYPRSGHLSHGWQITRTLPNSPRAREKLYGDTWPLILPNQGTGRRIQFGILGRVILRKESRPPEAHDSILDIGCAKPSNISTEPLTSKVRGRCTCVTTMADVSCQWRESKSVHKVSVTIAKTTTELCHSL